MAGASGECPCFCFGRILAHTFTGSNQALADARSSTSAVVFGGRGRDWAGYMRGVSVATDRLIDQLLLPFIHLAVRYDRVSGTGRDTPLNNRFFACFCSALGSDFGRHSARLPAIAESHIFIGR